ncbi:MAG: efflux RND transporter periplasmic adaptor subunit [Bacteroidales bacterium]|nr:efflux RND transporter periplasmic adaptor subunit [Bacteroidales bacterium]MCF8337073.1 efflux RND transporter periplasmic adaptor subunit [Bacteroidales bacterium]
MLETLLFPWKSPITHKTFVLLFIPFLFLVSCRSGDENRQEQANRQGMEEKNKVDTLVLREKTFSRELTGNGKLAAVQKAKLRFGVSGELKKIGVQNGQQVQEGQMLAKLKDFSYRNALKEARTRLNKAKVSLQDVLIGQGYNPEDTASVPDNFMEIAKIKSGVEDARTKLAKARHQLKMTSLSAPFPGVVANIEKKEFDKIDASENFCLLINNNRYHVVFKVLESELDELALHKTFMAKTMTGDSYKGRITHINPVVDENGLVTVRGLIDNKRGQLVEGMNVKVTVRTKIPGKLIIPKRALVLRQNKEVVFTLKHDSIAIWNYVTTGEENSKYYTIKEGLDRGDTVIVSNNINLAHESIVEVESPQQPKQTTR